MSLCKAEEGGCCPYMNNLKNKLRAFFFWYLYISILLPLTAPIMILYTIIMMFHEKKNTPSLSLIAWDTLGLRWILSQFGAKPDPYTDAIMEEGLPGLSFLSDLPNVNRAMAYYHAYWPFQFLNRITGHVPDLMRIDPSPESFGSLYTTRMTFIDEQLTKNTEMGSVEQLVSIGPGWDFRSIAFRKDFPAVSCIEVDVPAMQTIKAAACKRHNIPISPITLIPHKLMNRADVAELRSKIDMNKKTFVIVEGVSYFLNIEVVESLVRLVKELPAGSKLCMDLWIKAPCSYKFWDWKIGKCLYAMACGLIGDKIISKIDLQNGDALATLDSFCQVVSQGTVEISEAEPTYFGAVAIFQRS